MSSASADTLLTPQAANAVRALHELASNTTKYGSLVAEGGRIIVTRHVEAGAAGSSAIPDHISPIRENSGSELNGYALPYRLKRKTKLKFRADGVRWTVLMPVSASGREARDE
jgi:two-component sensor histidine kinase